MSTEVYVLDFGVSAGERWFEMVRSPASLHLDRTRLETVATNSSSVAENGNVTVYELMLISERVLRRDWDHPDEDEAWAHL